jgi:hypothetical protein
VLRRNKPARFSSASDDDVVERCQEPGLIDLADALHRMQHVQSARKVCEAVGLPVRSAASGASSQTRIACRRADEE